MKRPRKMSDGELSPAIRRNKQGHYIHGIKCCDCGLEHVMRYELTAKGSLRFRAWRLPKQATRRSQPRKATHA